MAEILVVLVIVSVLVGMAVPSMTGFVERTRTRRALDHIAGDIALARQLAVQRGSPVAISIAANGTYSIDTLSSGNSWSAAKTVHLGTEFAGIQVEGTAARFEFSSRGLLTAASDTGFITVRVNSARDSAVVTGAGRVYRAY